MMPARDNIDAWKERLRRDPKEALNHILNRIASIPESEKKAIFSHIPEDKNLESSFIKAAENLDQPLGGVPYLLKDLFDVAGLETHCGSPFLAEVRGTPGNSCALFDDMEKHGALFCGKTQMNEFAYGLSGRNDHFGSCPHPYFPDRLSGGSSSGSAWAVGSGLVPLAFGTDTGGSIRTPASFCGIYGMRLFPGNAWITEGAFPLAPTFDTTGWFTGTADDMITTLSALLGTTSDGKHRRGFYFDAYDDMVEPNLLEKYRITAQKLDLAIIPDHSTILRKVFEGAAEHYKVIVSIEAWRTHKGWLETHRHDYSERVWDRIHGGSQRTMDDLLAARDFSDYLRDAVYELLVDFDYLVIPAVPYPAIVKDGMTEDIRTALLQLTAPGSFAGLPILTLPVFLDNGLSGGLQVIYRKETDNLPVNVLEALDQAE